MDLWELFLGGGSCDNRLWNEFEYLLIFHCCSGTSYFGMERVLNVCRKQGSERRFNRRIGSLPLRVDSWDRDNKEMGILYTFQHRAINITQTPILKTTRKSRANVHAYKQTVAGKGANNLMVLLWSTSTKGIATGRCCASVMEQMWQREFRVIEELW